MFKLALIFLGSGVGGVCRYTLAGCTQRLGNGSFPVGTLAVNVTGCFLIGLLVAALSGRFIIREEYRIALIVGVLGGYTTFSAFGMETFALLNDSQFGLALANVAASVVLGLIAVWGGFRLAENWLGP